MKRTAEASVLTELILEIFRLNGQLLAAGDHLTKPVGLTSARWQVLGTIELAGHPLSVAQASRRIGVSRQSVQRIANDLQALGFITFEINPDHARAKLITPTNKGRDALAQINSIQIEWSNALAQGLDLAGLRNAADVLNTVAQRCDKTSTRPTIKLD